MVRANAGRGRSTSRLAFALAFGNIHVGGTASIASSVRAIPVTSRTRVPRSNWSRSASAVMSSKPSSARHRSLSSASSSDRVRGSSFARDGIPLAGFVLQRPSATAQLKSLRKRASVRFAWTGAPRS